MGNQLTQVRLELKEWLNRHVCDFVHSAAVLY